MKKKLLIAILVIILLAVGVVAAYMLWPKEKDSIYGEYYDIKVAAFEQENNELKNTDIAFIGDSITDGYALYGSAYSSYKVAWRGISGDTTTGLYERLRVSLYDVNPKVVVLLIGINNIDSMFEDYEDIIRDINEKLPSADLIVQSLHPTSGGLAYRNDLIKKSNKKILELSVKYGFTYVDMNTHLTNPETGEYSSLYTDDGLHPNEKGYEKITEVLLPIIEEKLKNTD